MGKWFFMLLLCILLILIIGPPWHDKQTSYTVDKAISLLTERPPKLPRSVHFKAWKLWCYYSFKGEERKAAGIEQTLKLYRDGYAANSVTELCPVLEQGLRAKTGMKKGMMGVLLNESYKQNIFTPWLQDKLNKVKDFRNEKSHEPGVMLSCVHASHYLRFTFTAIAVVEAHA